MKNTLLVGRRVKILGNEFTPKLCIGKILCDIAKTNSIVIELDQSITVDDGEYKNAVASPRLPRHKLDAFFSVGAIGCGITWVPIARFDPKNPLDLSLWRGGAAAISDVALID
jgi:hypothetical protein